MFKGTLQLKVLFGLALINLWPSPVQAQPAQTLRQHQAVFEWVPELHDPKKLAIWHIHSFLTGLKGGRFHELSLQEALAAVDAIPATVKDLPHLGFHSIADIRPFSIVGIDNSERPVEIHFVVASGLTGIFRSYFVEQPSTSENAKPLDSLKKSHLVLIAVKHGKAMGYIDLARPKGSSDKSNDLVLSDYHLPGFSEELIATLFAHLNETAKRAGYRGLAQHPAYARHSALGVRHSPAEPPWQAGHRLFVQVADDAPQAHRKIQSHEREVLRNIPTEVLIQVGLGITDDFFPHYLDLLDFFYGQPQIITLLRQRHAHDFFDLLKAFFAGEIRVGSAALREDALKNRLETIFQSIPWERYFQSPAPHREKLLAEFITFLGEERFIRAYQRSNHLRTSVVLNTIPAEWFPNLLRQVKPQQMSEIIETIFWKNWVFLTIRELSQTNLAEPNSGRENQVALLLYFLEKAPDAITRLYEQYADSKDTRVLTLMQDIAQDMEHKTLQWRALGFLLISDQTQRVPEIIQAIRQKTRTSTDFYTNSEGVILARWILAWEATGHLSTQQAIAWLLDLARQKNTEAIVALAHFQHRSAATVLLALSQDENAFVRSQSATALGHQSDKRAQRRLLELTQDEKPEVREAAATAVGHYRRTAVLSRLMTLSRERDDGVRAAAAKGLGFQSGPRVTERLLALSRDSDRFVRQEALEALGHQHHTEKAVIDRLREASEDTNWMIRNSAAEALGYQTSQAAQEILVDLAQDTIADVKKTAKDSLALWNAQADASVATALRQRILSGDFDILLRMAHCEK